MAFLSCFSCVSLEQNCATTRHCHADKAEKESTDRAIGSMDCSSLLSLPQSVRLQIWKYVLIDPSLSKLHVRIQRRFKASNSSGERFSNSLYRVSESPEIVTCLETQRSTLVNISLLRVNRLIYAEGLPILYRSVVFCPWNIEGILPLFLNTLSPFAKANIRHFRLDYSRVHSKKGSLFYWALTCAQVAQLSDTLQSVEVTSHSSPGSQGATQTLDGCPDSAILYPLLKIKTPKTFVPYSNTDFQALLENAAKEMEAKADLRRASTAADAEDRRLKQENRRLVDHASHRTMDANAQSSNPEQRSVNNVALAVASEDRIASDLYAISGIRQFERELMEWEMINLAGSRIDTPSVTTIGLKDDWTDAASTFVYKDDQDESKSFKSFKSWDMIEAEP